MSEGGARAVPATITEWDARFREEPDALMFGRDPSDLARLTASYWKLENGDRRGRVLDLGCGEGRDAVFYAGKGFRVTAVDGSEAALEKAARLAEQMQPQGAPEIDFCRMDLLEFPLAPGYDLLQAHNSLQFVGDHALPTLRRIQEVTPPGGFNAISCFTREAEVLAARDDLFRFDRNELKFHYAQAGWRVLFYGEDILWRPTIRAYLSFARIIAQKTNYRTIGE